MRTSEHNMAQLKLLTQHNIKTSQTDSDAPPDKGEKQGHRAMELTNSPTRRRLPETRTQRHEENPDTHGTHMKQRKRVDNGW